MTQLAQLRLAISTILASLAVSSLAAAGGLLEINPRPPHQDREVLALVGARLVDGESDQAVDDSFVLIKDSQIIAAGPAATIDVPADAKIVELAGMTIVPGLIDSHMHTINDLDTPALFLVRGVTTFRDPGHPFRFYQAVMQTDQTMPRVFLCGAHLDAYPPIWPQQATIIHDSSQAREAVAEHVQRGASAIKIYFRLPLEYFQPICETADQLGVPVTAHLELVDADDAITAGVDAIEHVTSFGTAMSDPQRASDFKRAVAENPNARRELRYRMWANLDLSSDPVAAMIDQIVERDVIVSPTLAVFERRPGEQDATAAEAEGFANMLRFVGQCHRAGALIVVGSHTHVPFAEHGWAYHRELELLVEAGLTPAEAIRAGTSVNARFFGAEDRLGSIRPGQLADLVVVAGNPIESISALRDVKHVMIGGEWVGDAPE